MTRSCARQARTLRNWLPQLTPPWAWGVWSLLAVVAVIVVFCDPHPRSVTGAYRDASQRWFEGGQIYEPGVHGFLYFPQAAIAFAPFAYLPPALGEPLWRVAGIATFSLSIWRLALLLGQRHWPKLFSIITLFAIPPALSSARNGQMNLLLISLMTLAFVSLSTRRWAAAACWLCLGVALKPLMVVPLIAAVVAFPQVLRPLAFGLVLVALVPFLTQHPSYVIVQYRDCLEKLFAAGQPGAANPHADLFGLVSSLGWQAPLGIQFAARAAALALVPLICLRARRQSSAARTALLCLTFTAGYLSLFNPRMENNGYVLLAPSLGGLAAVALVRNRRRSVAWLMGLATFGITCSYQLSGGPNFWLSPLLSSLVLAYAAGEFISGRRRSRRAVGHLPAWRGACVPVSCLAETAAPLDIRLDSAP